MLMERRAVAATNGSAKALPPFEEQKEHPDQKEMAKVLAEVAEALEDAELPYAVIGGVASAGFGRPRWTHDIDIFVRPEDAETALVVLSDHGFHTEMTDHRWIYKAFKY